MSDLSQAEIAIQNRKFAKTCVEKKRRDRINKCLDELKDIMSQTEDKARYQKMEKAEILEMAVSYMKNMRNSQTKQSTCTAPEASQMYTMAFQQCMNEFQNFINVFPGVKEDFKTRIMNHMSQRYLELVSTYSNNNNNNNKNNNSNEIKRTKSARYSPYARVSPNKKNSIDSNNQDSFYQQNQKFGGSCSSLDSFIGINMQSQSPFESEHAYDSNTRLNLSSNSSPALSETQSECSSPVSQSKKTDLILDQANTSLSNSSTSFNFDLYQNCYLKVWRPW